MSFKFDKSGFSNPTQLVIGLFILVLLLMGIFWLARSIFSILAWLAPFLLVAAAIMNYRVIIEYVRTLIGWVKNNTIFGVVAIVLTILGFPFVSLFLALRAYNSRFGSKKPTEKKGPGEYIKYEELDEPDLKLRRRETHKRER